MPTLRLHIANIPHTTPRDDILTFLASHGFPAHTLDRTLHDTCQTADVSLVDVGATARAASELNREVLCGRQVSVCVMVVEEGWVERVQDAPTGDGAARCEGEMGKVSAKEGGEILVATSQGGEMRDEAEASQCGAMPAAEEARPAADSDTQGEQVPGQQHNDASASKLYVGNLPVQNVREGLAQVQGLFDGYAVEWFWHSGVRQGRRGHWFAFAFVQLKDEEAALAALDALDGVECGNGRTLRVRRAGTKVDGEAHRE